MQAGLKHMGNFSARNPSFRIGSLLSGMVLAVCTFVQAQTPVPESAASTPANASAAPKKQAVPPLQSIKVNSTMKWTELTAAQQTALRPLQPQWAQMSPDHQRKWLEISKNHARMPSSQQEAMQARMTEWAQMSPDKRAQARLNFVEAQEASKTLSAEEKRARWEAYQALSPEEKRKLARPTPAAKSAAPAITPVSPQRLIELPKRNASASLATPTRTPRITVSPDQVNSTTLLPQSGENTRKQ
jgi:Protein of unknown function (DUF3106)